MNYKSIIQYLNFTDHHETRHEWEYLQIVPTEGCNTLQDFCNLISDYMVNCEELKVHSMDNYAWYVMFKKGGSIRQDFPGQIIVAEYTEDEVTTTTTTET
jgi:hypothetical protein